MATHTGVFLPVGSEACRPTLNDEGEAPPHDFQHLTAFWGSLFSILMFLITMRSDVF